jgi:hypothetical protein
MLSGARRKVGEAMAVALALGAIGGSSFLILRNERPAPNPARPVPARHAEGRAIAAVRAPDAPPQESHESVPARGPASALASPARAAATPDKKPSADSELTALRVVLAARSPEHRARGLEELALVVDDLSAATRSVLVGEALRAAVSAGDDAARETAISALVLVDSSREPRVEESLANLVVRDANDPSDEQTSHESPAIRRAVAEVLACYPGENAARALHTLAHDTDVGVRIAAFYALATSRPDEAVIALEPILANDPEEAVRQAAREALAVALKH